MTQTPSAKAVSPTLFIFAGLPASGKTTLARLLAAHVGAIHLRIDTIEQALRDLCGTDVGGEGYRLAYRVAADNLRIGMSAVADSCNPLELTRDEWEAVASSVPVRSVNIEVICADPGEHQRRIAERTNDIAELTLPTWGEILQREYHQWTRPRIQIDTAGVSIAQAFSTLQSDLRRQQLI